MKDVLSKVTLGVAIRLVLVICIALSVLVIYYVIVVQGDYQIVESPDGPDMSDYYNE